jgi:hypothetical protein
VVDPPATIDAEHARRQELDVDPGGVFDDWPSGISKTSGQQLAIDPGPPLSGEETAGEGPVGSQPQHDGPDREREEHSGRERLVAIPGPIREVDDAGYRCRHRRDDEGTSNQRGTKKQAGWSTHRRSIGTPTRDTKRQAVVLLRSRLLSGCVCPPVPWQGRGQYLLAIDAKSAAALNFKLGELNTLLVDHRERRYDSFRGAISVIESSCLG